jgi:hypothetical protein
MPQSANPIYRRLGGRRWLRWQSDDGWLASDHLLFVRTRLFSEQYTRLYWNDIQALLLYRLIQNTGLMLVAEIACIFASVIAAFVQRRFESSALAFFHVVLYAAWRLTRRNYGVLVVTRTASVRIPLAVLHSSARRMVDELQQQVESVQGHLTPAANAPLTDAESAGLEPEPAQVLIVISPVSGKRRPTLVVHGIVFALGLTTWLFAPGSLLADAYWTVIGSALTVLFEAGLVAAWFVQQDVEFPFSVRSAAVMNLALQTSLLGALLSLGAGLNFAHVAEAMLVITTPITLLRLLACLYGLVGIYKNSLDEGDKPAGRPRTGTNPLA